MSSTDSLTLQIELAQEAYDQLREAYIGQYRFNADPTEQVKQACLDMLLAATDLRMLMSEREILALAKHGQHSPLFLVWDSCDRLGTFSAVYAQLMRRVKKKSYVPDLEPLYRKHRDEKIHLKRIGAKLL